MSNPRPSTKGLKRAEPATTVREADQRVTRATFTVMCLEEARDYANYMPATKASINRALSSARGGLRHAMAVAGRLKRAAPMLLLLLLVGCSRVVTPIAPTSEQPEHTLQGIWTITAVSDQRATVYAKPGYVYRLDVQPGWVTFGDGGGGRIDIDRTQDGRRHVEGRLTSIPAGWRHLEPSIGFYCDIWQAEGFCELGLADSAMTGYLQGNVRF